MGAKYKKLSKVTWKWLGADIKGSVRQVYFKKIEKTIKGKKITRIGSKEKPAYLVKSQAGNLALKLETELHPLASAKPMKKVGKKSVSPKMFGSSK